MYSFKNDYSEICHPNIAKVVSELALQQHDGYGMDDHCENARNIIKKLINAPEADIHFFVGGTQTNLTVIGAFLRPHEAVISAHTGHINVHETGAIEATGHKVLVEYNHDGKLTPELIEHTLFIHGSDEHMVKPRMVYISNSTEIGTIYTKRELVAIRECCDKNDLLLYLDGARLGSALTCAQNDLSMEDLANLTDAFYIGATKNGGMLGEALVINSRHKWLSADFRYLLKQRGGLLAKGALIGIQYEELFKDNLYFELAKHANEMAEIIREALKECGVKTASSSPTNLIFPIFTNAQIAELEKDYIFSVTEVLDADTTVVRLVTSFATNKDEVIKFTKRLKEVVCKN